MSKPEVKGDYRAHLSFCFLSIHPVIPTEKHCKVTWPRLCICNLLLGGSEEFGTIITSITIEHHGFG